MSKKLLPDTATEASPATNTLAPTRTNEFSGLTEDARFELAVTRIRSAYVIANGAVTTMGQTLIDACHDGSEEEALADRADSNPLFRRIARSLGTVEGGPSKKSLSAARRVVAASRKVKGRFWTVLPFGHKEILTRLRDFEKMAAFAKRVVEFGLTRDQTEALVNAERALAGKARIKRGRPLTSARGTLRELAQSAEPESLDRLANDYEKLSPADQKKVRDELDKAVAALTKMRRKLG